MLSTADPLRRSRGAACLLHCYKRSAGSRARPWSLRSLPVCASTENVLAGWIQRHPQLAQKRLPLWTFECLGTTIFVRMYPGIYI